jgi:MFS family permease
MGVAQSPAQDPDSLPSGIPHTFRALRHRNFRLFIFGQIVSLVGTWMQTAAQSWLVYRLTHSELLLGTTWFCSQIAVFALGPLGGLAADRFSRRKIVIITQVLSMVQAFALAALTLTGVVQIWHVLVLSAALGVVNAFDMPARQSLVIEMTSKRDLINAISLNSMVFNSGRVIGPAVAGVLLTFLHEGTCFFLNGVSFLAVIFCLAAMRLPRFERREHPPLLRQLTDGFRYICAHSPVRRILMLMGASTLAGMPGLVLMPFFAQDIFHRGSQGYGLLMSAMGIGAVFGTLFLARRSRTHGLASLIAFSGISTGLAYLAFAMSTNYYLSLAVMLMIGYSVIRQMACANTTIQTLIPEEYRGRTMALYAMVVIGLGPFGSLAAGGLAHQFGPRITMALGGILALAASIAFSFTLRRDPIAA